MKRLSQIANSGLFRRVVFPSYCTVILYVYISSFLYLVSHCSLCFQFVEVTAQVTVTVIVAPSCVSVRVSGCRIFLKFTLALKRAIVVILFIVFCL